MLHGIPAAPARLLTAAVLCAVVGFGLLAGGVSPGRAVALVQSIMGHLRGAGIAGPAAFAALQVLVALSGALPASLLGVAAGAVYGLGLGFALAAFGSLLGAVIAFELSRSLFRPAIVGLVARHASLSGLDASLLRHGWKFVCLLRLSPVMPFSATSYLLGLSSVGFPEYLAGTFASLPALFGYVLLGTLTDAGISSWASGSNPVGWILWGVGGAATLFLTIWVGRLVLRRQIACN